MGSSFFYTVQMSSSKRLFIFSYCTTTEQTEYKEDIFRIQKILLFWRARITKKPQFRYNRTESAYFSIVLSVAYDYTQNLFSSKRACAYRFCSGQNMSKNTT